MQPSIVAVDDGRLRFGAGSGGGSPERETGPQTGRVQVGGNKKIAITENFGLAFGLGNKKEKRKVKQGKERNKTGVPNQGCVENRHVPASQDLAKGGEGAH